MNNCALLATRIKFGIAYYSTKKFGYCAIEDLNPDGQNIQDGRHPYPLSGFTKSVVNNVLSC